MALASDVDVASALGVDSLTSDQSARTPTLLDEASDLVTGYLSPRPIPDPVPDTIRRVVARMVARVIDPSTNSSIVGATSQQYTAGTYQTQATFAPDTRTGSAYLTKTDKISLRRFKFGAVSIATWG